MFVFEYDHGKYCLCNPPSGNGNCISGPPVGLVYVPCLHMNTGVAARTSKDNTYHCVLHIACSRGKNPFIRMCVRECVHYTHVDDGLRPPGVGKGLEL
jgi:hypothetical protein